MWLSHTLAQEHVALERHDRRILGNPYVEPSRHGCLVESIGTDCGDLRRLRSHFDRWRGTAQVPRAKAMQILRRMDKAPGEEVLILSGDAKQLSRRMLTRGVLLFACL